jgi:hypothetical protein
MIDWVSNFCKPIYERFLKKSLISHTDYSINKKLYENKYHDTTFELVHYRDVVLTQEWATLDGLKTKQIEMDKNKEIPVNNEFNEYFLGHQPIRAKKDDNNKYWIIDGNHRFYRGLLQGYNYFLLEVHRKRYRPVSRQAFKCLNIVHSRNKDTINPTDLTNEDLNIVKKLHSTFINVCNMSNSTKQYFNPDDHSWYDKYGPCSRID